MSLTYYRRITEGCAPFVIARGAIVDDLELSPLGLSIDHVYDPQLVAHGPFMQLVQHLDLMAYGPRALSMPSWVFYDCAVVPGAVFGFGRMASDLEPWVRSSMQVPDDYDGLVPMSLFTAIPMAHRKAQLVYSLCSINQVAPGAAPEGLWRLTLAAGTAALGIEVMVATAQWRSAQLGLYANLGPLKVMTAWTPAHDIPETTTFYVFCDDDARQRLLRGDLVSQDAVGRYLDADDRAALQTLQAEIEAGLEAWVMGPAEIRGSETRIPIHEHVEPGSPPPRAADHFVRRFQG